VVCNQDLSWRVWCNLHLAASSCTSTSFLIHQSRRATDLILHSSRWVKGFTRSPVPSAQSCFLYMSHLISPNRHARTHLGSVTGASAQYTPMQCRCHISTVSQDLVASKHVKRCSGIYFRDKCSSDQNSMIGRHHIPSRAGEN
jgi:hypothetical protein